MTRSVGVSRLQARYDSWRAAAERRHRPTTGAWTSTSSPYALRGPAEIATRGLSVRVLSTSRRAGGGLEYDPRPRETRRASAPRGSPTKGASGAASTQAAKKARRLLRKVKMRG